ncbi:SRPBCC domain-containing protein [Allomuricauda sp. d1]|uniref:SRPBCC family protein n=1 Tax=Allomuricauda sp. d1 TaxID=3136725 RepID=UPI0031D692A6
MKDTITKEYFFNHSIDKVWNAISREEEISSWFIKANFKAEKGYRYTFKADEEHGCTQITGEVKEANPYTLIYTWVVEGTKAVTTVTWRLEQIDGKTKLNLQHSGISNYAGETAVSMFNSFSAGWDNCAEELTKFLNREVHA